MKKFIEFGRFSRFYWLLLASASMKLLITIFLKLDYYDPKKVNQAHPNFALLNEPELNNHILINHIYYYFGFTLFSMIFLIVI